MRDQLLGRWSLMPVSLRWRRGQEAAEAPATPAGLADPGPVLQPDLDALSFGMGRRGLGDQIATFFLKSAGARRFALGCTGRVFRQEK